MITNYRNFNVLSMEGLPVHVRFVAARMITDKVKEQQAINNKDNTERPSL